MIEQHKFWQTELRHLVSVPTIDELEWLVKESELVTGSAGRDFVIAGAERLAFHVRLQCDGFQICRNDLRTDALPFWTAAPDLRSHTLGHAIACGLVYTNALQ
jgi:hypothetical protein